jgi:hypothetical protein
VFRFHVALDVYEGAIAARTYSSRRAPPYLNNALFRFIGTFFLCRYFIG